MLFTRTTPVADVPPSFTVMPAKKPVPVMVTAVPPLVVPELGVIEVTVGAELDGESGGLGVVVPPPQPVSRSARSNTEETGNQCLRDIRGN